MNKSLVGILTDPTLLDEYIRSLEIDIDSTADVDKKVDELIESVLKKLNNFKDCRSFKSNNIEAITNLLRFKAELPQKRVQIKKTILDIACKKEELAIKKSLAASSEALANNSGNLLQLLFSNLDAYNVNPIITEAEITSEACNRIVDNCVETLILADNNIEDETEVKDIKTEILSQMEESTSSKEILKLQEQLDTLQQIDAMGDNNGETEIA